MKLVGKLTRGATAYEIVADTKRTARFYMPQESLVAKGSMYLDGLGSGIGPSQACRQVVYSPTDALLAISDEVVVADGQPGGWVDFPYSAPFDLPVGYFSLGVIAGVATNVIRAYGDDPSGAGGRTNADTYGDGASPTFGTATTLTSDLSAYLSYFSAYASIVPTETPLYFSRLPFEEAQYVLGIGGLDSSVARFASLGWHYTSVDPEVGSNALVRDGSEFADLLGKRIRVEVGGAAPRGVNAYVHALAPADFEWDISLTRSLYGRLAPLSADPFAAAVRLIGTPT